MLRQKRQFFSVSVFLYFKTRFPPVCVSEDSDPTEVLNHPLPPVDNKQALDILLRRFTDKECSVSGTNLMSGQRDKVSKMLLADVRRQVVE